jgi:signal transduction histidine kinase
MIRNYLENASLLARQAGVSLLFSEEEPVYVWGDPFLIQEVIQNYYSNALHHAEEPPSALPQGPLPQTPSPVSDGKAYADETAPGEPLRKVIEIRCDQREEHVRVTVFNTGKPIPEDALPHIWEKFYKVDKARTRAYGGSGVGLSIVKAIMDLHHRGYGAENYENGVAFWFELDRSGTDDEPVT